MSQYKIVFSDVDGTLLNSNHQITPLTLQAIRTLQKKGIPFVIVSARGPSGIYPILEEYGFSSPIIAYSGGLILNEEKKILYQRGMSRETAAQVVHFLEKEKLDLSWGVYAGEDWLVRDKNDVRIQEEERIVKAQARKGDPEDLPEGAAVHKILCICSRTQTEAAEQKVKEAFPSLSVVKSSDTLLEIMEEGVTKAEAVGIFCRTLGITPAETVAFGDNYNDMEMLQACGCGFLMGNAPEKLLEQFPNHTLDHDHDGICAALKECGCL